MEFKPEHHREFAMACIDGNADLVKQYIAAGYDANDRTAWNNRTEDSGIIKAATFGNVETVGVLIKALKDQYLKTDPEKLVRLLVQTRSALGTVTRGFMSLLNAASGVSDRKDVETCCMMADREAHAVIDTLPVERRRVFQANYPPLRENAR